MAFRKSYTTVGKSLSCVDIFIVVSFFYFFFGGGGGEERCFAGTGRRGRALRVLFPLRGFTR